MDATVDNGQVQHVEKELLYPLLSLTAGHVAIGHPISIVNMPHVTVIICHNRQFYRIPVFIVRTVLLRVDHECLSGDTRLS